jgi:hypothetical protein
MLVGRSDECDVLDRVLGDVRGGQSGVLVLRGEPGVGARAAGVESEMELAYLARARVCER